MGTLRAQCEHCLAKMKLPAEAAGRKMRCPKCQQPFRVPAQSDEPPTIGLADEEPQTRSAVVRETFAARTPTAHKAARSHALAAAPLEAAPAEPALDMFEGLSSGSSIESDDDRAERLSAEEARRSKIAKDEAAAAKAAAKSAKPAKRKSTAGGTATNLGETLAAMAIALISLGFWGRINLAIFLFGVAALWTAIHETRVNARSSPTPHVISCADLTANGPGSNYPLRMQDFLLLPNYVYETKRGDWTRAWVPAMPVNEALKVVAADTEAPLDEISRWSDEQIVSALEEIDFEKFTFRVVVEFGDVNGTMDVQQKFLKQEIHGTVLGSLDRDARRIFTDSYPNLDINRCLVLVDGRVPWSKVMVTNLYFLSAAFFIGGLFMLVQRARHIHDNT